MRLVTKSTISALCRCFGYSRQGYYSRVALDQKRRGQAEGILTRVYEIRQRQPRVGGRKLYRMIAPEGYGRDRFFELLRGKDLLVATRRSHRRTTYAGPRRFPNLARTLEVKQVGDLTVSDITYLETEEGFCYLFLSTDYYSRKILGYALRKDMTCAGSIKAMKRTLANRSSTTAGVHHSDQGWQYGAKAFQDLLKAHGMRPSMTEMDHVYENAVAERVNGILKTEFLLSERLLSYDVAKKMVSQAIKIYNDERIHMSLDYKTPSEKFKESVNYFRT